MRFNGGCVAADGGTTDDNWSGGGGSWSQWGGSSWSDHSNPCCYSSPQEGVLSAVNRSSFSYDPSGLWNKDATAAPVSGEVAVDFCSMDPYNDIEDLIVSIPDTWHPAGAGTEPTISIYAGPNSVSTSSFTSTNLRGIAENMQVDMAEAIRQDPLDITIFTIGLGNVDKAVMSRVANDPRSVFYNSTQPEGEFAYAADIGKLLSVFKDTAGGIARLSQ